MAFESIYIFQQKTDLLTHSFIIDPKKVINATIVLNIRDYNGTNFRLYLKDPV